MALLSTAIYPVQLTTTFAGFAFRETVYSFLGPGLMHVAFPTLTWNPNKRRASMKMGRVLPINSEYKKGSGNRGSQLSAVGSEVDSEVYTEAESNAATES